MSYFFKSKNDAVIYLLRHLKDATPVKIQKGLYFLWAYYAATYGHIDHQVDSEFNKDYHYPEELFQPAFVALKYGPVDTELYQEYNDIKLADFKHREPKISVSNESARRQVELFLNDLIESVDKVDDFGLVIRSRQDKTWSKTFNSQQDLMDPEAIKKEYIGYVAGSTQS